ncbi:MAG: hypothetical protein QOJ63_2823 [Solirubrobacteraceae bacterium]|jgi:hypothetical protein|nr:hypothetical protein [Solirubrobacteraceae bacterium]
MEDLLELAFIVTAVFIAVAAAITLTAVAGTIAAICVFGAATHGFFVTLGRGILHRGGATALQGPDEPAFRSYYRAQVWRDLKLAAATAWQRAGDETTRIQALTGQGTSWYAAVFRFILLVYGYIGLAIGALLAAIVGVIPAVLIGLFALGAWAVGAPLRGLERLRRKRRGTYFDCPECHDRFPLPVYVCPTCSAEHRQLAPGPFGVLRHRCTCASRLPAVQWRGRERLTSQCPAQGHSLGEGVGMVRTFHVPVAGGPSTGKSTFLAAAMFGLEEAAAAGTLSTAVQSSSRDGYDRLLDGFRMGVLPAKTVDLQAPALVAEVRGTDKSALLYAYDVAGEAYGDEQELRRDPGYGLAEGVVLLVDPFALQRVRTNFADEIAAEPGLRPSPEAPQRVLERLAGVLDEKGLDPSKLPAAISITKCDGLGIGDAIEASDGDDEDARVRAWLEAMGAGNLLRSAEDTFKEIHCFSTSALGRTPGSGTGAFTPRGTLDPLLWLLATAGVKPAAAGAAGNTQTERLSTATPLKVAPRRPLFAGVISAVTPWPIVANFALGLLAFGALAVASAPLLNALDGSDLNGGDTAFATAASSEEDDAEPADDSSTTSPPPPPPAGSPAADAVDNPNSPSRVLRRHFQQLSSGDVDRAFALMSSRFRNANPGWPSERRAAQPYLNVLELGPSNVQTPYAYVHIKFYGRDSNNTSVSDTVCRSFEGDARMYKQDGAWRYDPAKGQYTVTEFKPALQKCIR